MKSTKKIYLIGLPGTGKSFFGRLLSDELNIPFFDLDHHIEEKEGRKITDIFEKDGEGYFREVESACLKELSNQESFVIATGGGAPCFHKGIDLMNEIGITVYLTETKQVLVERLSRKSHRPLMQNDVANRVDQLLATRGSIYEQADVTIPHRDAKALIALLNF